MKYTGTLCWLDSKPDRYDGWNCTIAVDPSSEDWQRFCELIDALCEDDDVCRTGPDLTKNMGAWVANALNEHPDITTTWHESDQVLRFKAKKQVTDYQHKVGDTVTVSFTASTYSFTPSGKYEVIEGISLRLLDVA